MVTWGGSAHPLGRSMLRGGRPLPGRRPTVNHAAAPRRSRSPDCGEACWHGNVGVTSRPGREKSSCWLSTSASTVDGEGASPSANPRRDSGSIGLPQCVDPADGSRRSCANGTTAVLAAVLRYYYRSTAVLLRR
jgi:hypothetical protein